MPFGGPNSGLGLALGAVALYNPNSTPHQWVTGGGAAVTGSGTKGILAFHSMSSRTDRFRLTARISYADQDNKFYGIGAEAGDRDDPLKLDNTSFALSATASWRILPHVFAGLSYRLATNDAAPEEPDDDEIPSSTPPPPPDQLDSTLSMVGPTISFDTRDSHTQPRRGVELNLTWLFGRGTLGDSFNHEKLTVEGHFYRPLSARTVVAGSAMLCSASGDVPYYNLCFYGSGSDLRGYPSGRYRDRASWAVQGELRRQFSSRWGGAAFAGLGGIAPSAGDIFSDSHLLPAAGVGLRYRLFRDNDVQVRLDFAVGDDAHGIYLGFGEAF